ncbi:hypothetical protein ACMAUO_07025 [Gluconacetobacter sp. Hr-1-5]
MISSGAAGGTFFVTGVAAAGFAAAAAGAFLAGAADAFFTL